MHEENGTIYLHQKLKMQYFFIIFKQICKALIIHCLTEKMNKTMRTNKLYKLICTNWGNSLWLCDVIIYFFSYFKIIQSNTTTSICTYSITPEKTRIDLKVKKFISQTIKVFEWKKGVPLKILKLSESTIYPSEKRVFC